MPRSCGSVVYAPNLTSTPVVPRRFLGPEVCQRFHRPSEGVLASGRAAAAARDRRSPGGVEGLAGEAEGGTEEERPRDRAGGSALLELLPGGLLIFPSSMGGGLLEDNT